MDAQIDRLVPLLTDLTELHDQVLGPLELELQPTPLGPWLTDLAVVWRAGAQQNGITWRADIPLDLPTATIDAHQLARAVGNLLSNAVKFTPSGGTIWVQAQAGDVGDAPGCRIVVRDDGPGIPLAEQERIFEPFRVARSNGVSPRAWAWG